MRKPRFLQDDAWYHVTARANRKECIFDKRDAKELIIYVINSARRKYGFQLSNFCVMDNHIHLLIKPAPGVALSEIMRWILGVFASRFNRIFQLTGHVWGDRFFSRIIRSLSEYVRTFRYIDDNPSDAGMVTDRRDWLYGRFRRSITDHPDFCIQLPEWIANGVPDNQPD